MPETTPTRTVTVEQARAAVLASGELEALDGPHYRTGRGGEWDSVFLADDEHPHPDFARVIITRRGQAAREIAIGWADYAEVIEDDSAPERAESERDWNEKRSRKPMSIFGAEAERHAYRVVFADVLAPLLDGTPRTSQASAGDRDFEAEFEAAQTVKEIDKLGADARKARAFSPDATGTALHRAWRRRHQDLVAAEAATAWEPAAVTSGTAADVLRVGAQIAPVVDEAIADATAAESTEAASTRTAPRDHLPPADGNRATRRAANRKKGRRK